MTLVLLVLLVVLGAVHVRRALRLPWERPFLRAARDWLIGVGGATAAMLLLSGSVAGVVAVLSLAAGGFSAVRTAGRESWRLLQETRAVLDGSGDPVERTRILVHELEAMEVRRGRPEGSTAEAVALVVGGASVIVGVALAMPVVAGLGAAMLALPVQTAARWLGEGAAYRKLRVRMPPLGREAAALRAAAPGGPPEGGEGEDPLRTPRDRREVALPGDPSLAGMGVGDLDVLRGTPRIVLRRTAPGVREYELAAGGDLVGELVGATREGFVAAGECMGEAWDIEVRRRFLSFQAVEGRLVRSGGDEEGLSFQGRSWGSVRILLPDGTRYRWGRPWVGRGGATLLRDGARRRVLRYRTAFFRMLRGTTYIEVQPGAWDLPELPRLVLLTACLRLHMDSFGDRPFRTQE